MSSKFVRDAFRDSWAGKVPGIPYFDTINTAPNKENMPDLWASAEFQSFNEEPVSMGQPSCRRETGVITVVLSIRSGEGDDAITQAAEMVRDAYRYWRIEGLSVTQVDPPIDTDGFSDGMWFIMDVDINYDFDQYK